MDRRGKCLCCSVICQLTGQAEFISAVARGKAVAFPCTFLERLRDHTQGAVALRVSEAVVDRFEIVSINQEEVEPIISMLHLQLFRQVDLQAVAIIQTCQRIAQDHLVLRIDIEHQETEGDRHA